MLVIYHEDKGWSVSNDAEVTSKSLPNLENGKIKSITRIRYVVAKGIFTVSGKIDKKVKIAIKDDVTGEVSGFDCSVTPNGFLINSECSTDWLKNI